MSEPHIKLETKIKSDLAESESHVITEGVLWYRYYSLKGAYSVDFSSIIEDFLSTLQSLQIIQKGMICVGERFVDKVDVGEFNDYDVWCIYEILVEEWGD